MVYLWILKDLLSYAREICFHKYLFQIVIHLSCFLCTVYFVEVSPFPS